jgi:hypothetical protein
VKLSPKLGYLTAGPPFDEGVNVVIAGHEMEMRSPRAQVFAVADDREVPSKVGRLAKQLLFADTPAFEVRVLFSVGKLGRWLRSQYSDHEAPLFNSFFGVYEIEWLGDEQRHFGLEPDGRLRLSEFVQLGRADWALFSARPYGVPLRALRPLVGGPPECTEVVLDPALVAPDPWKTALVELRAPSPLAARPSILSWQLLTPLWRLGYGRLRRGQPQIVTVPVRSILYARFDQGPTQRPRTLVVGGALRCDEGAPLDEADYRTAWEACLALVQESV